jgi:hypothetical protein
MHPLYAPFETQDKAFDSSRASQGRQGKKGGVPEKARRDSSSRSAPRNDNVRLTGAGCTHIGSNDGEG